MLLTTRARHVAVAGIEVGGQPGGLYPWLRLAFQPRFVWLAVWSSREPAPSATHEPAPTPPTRGAPGGSGVPAR